MRKEDVQRLKDQAENNCRIYFDQLNTLQQQEQQVSVALEQERGKLRAYDGLLEVWEDPKPMLQPLPPQATEGTENQDLTPQITKESAIPVPLHSKSNKE